MFPVFILSGLFLGWSLGANDAANVYGTAVGTRMIRFRTAAIACSAFVILGAVVSGSGASETLGRLGPPPLARVERRADRRDARGGRPRD